MSDSLTPDSRQSPLNECDVAAPERPRRRNSSPVIERVVLNERPFLGHINLRGDVGESVASVFGVTLPSVANTVNTDGTGIALWTGPDEWLLIHASAEDRERVAELERHASGKHVSIVDVSSAQTVIYVSGAGARDVLARGCPLDLHPRSFGPGQCAQTHYGHIPVTVWLDNTKPDPESDPWFNLVVRRSFADYAWRLLDDAASSVRASA